MTYEEFIAKHGDDPNWIKLRGGFHFESDLRRALAGDASGFHEIAIFAPDHKVQPWIIRDLWSAGVPIKPQRRHIKRMWKVSSWPIKEAFGEDLDRFLRDAGFDAGKLPDEFNVWRGGTEPIDEMTGRRSWTYSYSVACAFALNKKLWRTARTEHIARELGIPEPHVVTRRVRREHALWIGGPEREVILLSEALVIPLQLCGSLSEWRRHRARKEVYVA